MSTKSQGLLEYTGLRDSRSDSMFCCFWVWNWDLDNWVYLFPKVLARTSVVLYLSMSKVRGPSS